MKKYIYYVVLITLFLVVGFAIYLLMNQSPPIDEQKNPNPIIRYEPEYITYTVGKGTIQDYYKTTGTVVSKGEELSKLCYNFESIDQVTLLINKGEKFSYGDTLFMDDNEIIKAETSGKVIDIVYLENTIEIVYLDYQNQYIVSSIKVEDEDKINLETKVELFYNGQAYDAQIDYIDYKVHNESVYVHLETDRGFLLGTTVDVLFIKETKNNVIAVPVEYIYYERDSVYVNVMQENNDIVRVYVVIGINNGEYAEIVQGNLKVGQKIVRLKDQLGG